MFKRFLKYGEQGFTLIELLVVILIIGILLAVAASAFLNQTSKANVSVLKQNENAAALAVKEYQTGSNTTAYPTSASTPPLNADIIATEGGLTGTLSNTTIDPATDAGLAGDGKLVDTNLTTGTVLTLIGSTSDGTIVQDQVDSNGVSTYDCSVTGASGSDPLPLTANPGNC